MRTENQEEQQNQNKMDDAIKITITKEAEKILSEAVKRVNGDFEGGKVNRQVVASWLLVKACDELSDVDVKAIRADNFDPAIALTALYKRIQETGQVPPELKQLLLTQVGLDAPAKKTSKSKLTRESTNDVLDVDLKIA